MARGTYMVLLRNSFSSLKVGKIKKVIILENIKLAEP